MFSPTGLWAVHAHTWAGHEKYVLSPIVSFTAQGQALVCHEQTGELTLAATDNSLQPVSDEPDIQVLFFEILPTHRVIQQGYITEEDE